MRCLLDVFCWWAISFKFMCLYLRRKNLGTNLIRCVDSTPRNYSYWKHQFTVLCRTQLRPFRQSQSLCWVTERNSSDSVQSWLLHWSNRLKRKLFQVIVLWMCGLYWVMGIECVTGKLCAVHPHKLSVLLPSSRVAKLIITKQLRVTQQTQTCCWKAADTIWIPVVWLGL